MKRTFIYKAGNENFFHINQLQSKPAYFLKIDFLEYLVILLHHSGRGTADTHFMAGFQRGVGL